MKHYYYLHTNGSLIHKPYSVLESDPDYFVSDFVRKFWVVDTEKRETAWMLAIEALALGADRKQVAELEKKWGLTDEDVKVFTKYMKLKIVKSGKFFQAWDLKDYHQFKEFKITKALIIRMHMCSITFRKPDGDKITLNVGTGATALDALAELARGMMRRRGEKNEKDKYNSYN